MYLHLLNKHVILCLLSKCKFLNKFLVKEEYIYYTYNTFIKVNTFKKNKIPQYYTNLFTQNNHIKIV